MEIKNNTKFGGYEMRNFVLFALLATLVLAACAPAAPAAPAVVPTAMPMNTPVPTEAPQTIVDIAVADGRFGTLVAAVQAAGLVETLSGEGPFTVFAPTDDAFAKLPAGTLEDLLKPENKQMLTDILLYHVVPGSVKAADVVSLTEAATALGKNVSVKVEGDKVYINDAMVIITDIVASNGIIHVVDTVILPPAEEVKLDIVDLAVANGSFETLVAAVQAAGLVETLKGEGPFTVFAPTDEAFAKLPEGTVETLLKPENKQMLTDILLYHVVPGSVPAADVSDGLIADSALGTSLFFKVDMGKVYINEAEIVMTDVEASNGIIHVIDTVILPKDIVDAAVFNKFDTLVAAVQAAELVDTLKGEGPFTVFAPTNDAFAKLPEGTLDSLLKPENKQQLTDILLYHVVPGSVPAADVSDGLIADSALGTSLFFKVDMDKVYINEAEIIVTDIKTTNGIIHVIDTVILPKDIVDAAVFNKFETLAAALTAAELIDTLKGEGPFTVFAPTDEAFAKLPAGTLDTLLKPENKKQLTDILLYHVVAANVPAEEVVNLTEAATVLGKNVTVKVEGDKVYVNDAQVVIVDIKATNGIIHVIDTVLLPPQ